MTDTARVDDLIQFYETLTPATLATIEHFYAEDAYFKDPFNEVTSLREIRAIFVKMFRTLQAPRFTVTERIVGDDLVALTWHFDFEWRGSPFQVHGATVLRFGSDGRVTHHRDYWDVAEELYEKLPVVGTLMRWLKRRAG